MPNHQPYQNSQQGAAGWPQGQQRPEGASTSLGIGQQPQESAENLAGRARQAVDQVKTSAIERVGDVRSRAESGIADQRGKIVDRVNRVGDVLRGASDTLRHEDEMVARYLEKASQSVGRVAEYVNTADPRMLASDVQQFARSRPVWFIGGAFVAGLALGRLFRSSPPGQSTDLIQPQPIQPVGVPDWDDTERF